MHPPPRESAVLILVHPVAGQDHTLLMRRPVYAGVHSGQIAFPGGKREAADASLIDTALREFREETGAATSAFEIVGELSRIHIPPSRTLVTPVVAWAPALGNLVPDPHEVDALLDVPLAHLLRNDILHRMPIPMGPGRMDRMAAYWDVNGEVVWGATAMMIAELRTVLGFPVSAPWRPGEP
ncbi:MAG: CoA pyrophosphatase [Flavobacteriales bacterium]|nr:CoA pyrophosphatase [Flavobacteriales bacterium]MBP9080619.1 CoA pyrophosphatase [Flavobacteriales bacterium]